jgi:hypothetical protein
MNGVKSFQIISQSLSNALLSSESKAKLLYVNGLSVRRSRYYVFRTWFDTISHEKLVLKLINNFMLEPSLVKILCNNIINRQFKFFDGSKHYPTYAGIGQGSALGPLLFSLYVNDISSAINVPFILYADDLI